MMASIISYIDVSGNLVNLDGLSVDLEAEAAAEATELANSDATTWTRSLCDAGTDDAEASADKAPASAVSMTAGARTGGRGAARL